MIGNTDHGSRGGAAMRNVTGGGMPAELWSEIMIYAHDGKEPASLPPHRSRWIDEASLPWSGGRDRSEMLLRRVLGLFTGG